MNSSQPVICCPTELRPRALRQLHDGLSADQQAGLVLALDRTGVSDGVAWDGLLIAPSEGSVEDGELHGVLWVQQVAGNTAVLWPPPPDAGAVEPLFRAAAEFADARRIPLTQLLVTEHDGYDAALLTRCGFERLVELIYLFGESPPVSHHQTIAEIGDDGANRGNEIEFEGLHFVPHAGGEPGRLAAIIEQSYIGTCDCPGLEGVRPMDEVLEGYRSQGTYVPQHWYLVRDAAGDAAVLMLAYHRDAANSELVYMGVTPRARGRRLGEQIARFALHAAAEMGAERLVLAVDAANEPALEIYRRVGFVQWDRRLVYARLRRPT